MDASSRRLPWLLGLLGGVHGWMLLASLTHRSSHDEAARWVAALMAASGFFLGGWLHLRKSNHERGGSLWAGARILLSCVALGIAPLIIVWPRYRLDLVSWVVLVMSIAVPALPSALLLIRTETHGRVPRKGSLLAFSDRAELALAILFAVVLLPWYTVPHPEKTALWVGMMALPAIGIGLQVTVLKQRAHLIGEAFTGASVCDWQQGAFLSCDVGVGAQARALDMSPEPTYRTNPHSVVAVCQGSPSEGASEMQSVRHMAALVASAAIAHAAVLISFTGSPEHSSIRILGKLF